MNCPVKVRHQSNFYGGFFMGKVSVEQRIQSVLENIMSRKIPIYLFISFKGTTSMPFLSNLTNMQRCMG